MNKTLVVCAVVAVSADASSAPVAAAPMTVKEKKARAAVDERLAASAAKLTDCKHLKLVYDWVSFDALDFEKLRRPKLDMYGYETSNLTQLGDALNALCTDKDYKEVVLGFDTVIYRPALNDKITVKASVSGKTLTLENFCGGSTRGSSDYVKAMKAAL